MRVPAPRREQLRHAEIELMRQRERRRRAAPRSCPPGTAVQDYEFLEGPAASTTATSRCTAVRLSELFTGPGRALVIYHLMYGKRQTSPVPDVHAVDRRLRRRRDATWRRTSTSRSPPPRIPRPCGPTPARGLAEPAPAQLRGQHVQVRPRQRGRGRQPGLDHLGLHRAIRRGACATPTRRIPGWPTTSTSGASTC